MEIHHINNEHYTLEDFEKIISSGVKVLIGPLAQKAIIDCHEYLTRKLESQDQIIYGINTGFGALSSKHIPKEDYFYPLDWNGMVKILDPIILGKLRVLGLTTEVIIWEMTLGVPQLIEDDTI